MTKTQNQVEEARKTSQTIKIAIAAIVFVFAVFTAVLGRAGFFSHAATDSQDKLLAEALTFVGGLVGAIVSILGVLLKYSMDRQTESRLAFEQERTAALQDEAENRQTLEAATRVIQLFANSDGKEAPPIQIAAGLLTLSNLNQHSLSLVLTADLLRRKTIEASTACQVIDAALKQKPKNPGDPQIARDLQDIQINAISLLQERAEDMIANGLDLPMSIVNWDTSVCDYVREWAPIAVGTMMTKRSLATWRSDFRDYANVALSALSLGWLHDPNPKLKNQVGAILECLLRAFPNSGSLNHPREAINTVDIRDQLKKQLLPAESLSDRVTEVVRALNQWIADTDGPVTVGNTAPAPPS